MLKRFLKQPYLKLIISIVVVIGLCIFSNNYLLAIISIVELIMITITSKWIFDKSKLLAWLLNSFFTLCVLAQVISWFFGRTFITQIMIGNIVFLSSLGDKLPTYILGSALVILISLYPIYFPTRNNRNHKERRSASRKSSIVVVTEILSTLVLVFLIVSGILNRGIKISPISSIFETGRQVVETKYKSYALKKENEQKLNDSLKKFKQNEIAGGVAKPASVGEQPNVIVIWAEGMSKEVIDGNVTDLMPNVQRFENNSLSFENYYNHTAATVRGLRGQMVSGYQFADHDIKPESLTTSPLASLQDILGDRGYTTNFLNPEPNQQAFTTFLNSIRYDDIVSKKGETGASSDREMFDLLSQTINQQRSPFFVGMYTYGTHQGHDSDDIKYGDGNDEVLNKWFNFDHWFGEFYEQFENSPLFQNTILVLTTDHASWPGPEFQSALSSSQANFVAEIPLMISYPGINVEKRDVEGRNSLGLTPSILDLLDIQNEENYFLGSSLFTNEAVTPYEHVSALGDMYYETSSTDVKLVNSREIEEIKENIQDFYAISDK